MANEPITSEPATEPTCPNCVILMRKMEALIRDFEERFRLQESRIRDLEDELKRLKGTSPPPRPQEAIAPPAKKAPTGKKPGGQKGHSPHIRKWLPKERVTETISFVPKHCEQCQHALPAKAQSGDPSPTIYQTYELAKQLVDVTQYEGHARTCPDCQAVTRLAIPAEHRRSILGPRLSAMILHQSGVMGQSKRDIEETLEAVFELPISLGTIANLERQTSTALAPIHRAIRDEIDRASVKGLDETGWKEAGKKRWLWVASTIRSVYFSIHPRRNKTALADLLPSTTGIAITDRWKTYLHWPLDRRQLCWAHLNRNWEKLDEKIPTAKPLRDRWFAMKDGLFNDWHRFKAGELPRDHWTEKIRIHEKYFGVLLADGMKHVNQKVAGFCERLHAVFAAAFTFARHEGVEPTNNDTERVQRRAVTWRRTSFGCHSEAGCRFVERILSVVETLRLRKQSVLEFLTQVVEGTRTNQPVMKLA